MNSEYIYKLSRVYHRRVPQEIRAFLLARCVSASAIDRFGIGWNGWRITIPVANENKQVAFLVLMRGPLDTKDSRLFTWAHWATPELYGWEHSRWPKPRLLITDNVLERLVAESHGFPAVSPTHPDIFLSRWIKALSGSTEIAICCSPATRSLAERLRSSTPRAYVLDLKAALKSESLAEYFTTQQGSAEGLRQALETARLTTATYSLTPNDD